MFTSFGFLLICASIASAQFFRPGSNNQNAVPCGFSCTRQASFSVSIDGVATTARCTDSAANPAERCAGCCAARALAGGLQTTSAAGFPSTNGVDCVCCTSGPICRGSI